VVEEVVVGVPTVVVVLTVLVPPTEVVAPPVRVQTLVPEAVAQGSAPPLAKFASRAATSYAVGLGFPAVSKSVAAAAAPPHDRSSGLIVYSMDLANSVSLLTEDPS
jgi:hypothetical protein